MGDGSLTPLILTKLAPPRIGGVPIRRERLLRTLDAGRRRKLTLILGPTGCGKTFLSTLWRNQLVAQGCDVAWYSIGFDDDLGQFAAYLMAGFEAQGSMIGFDARGYLSRLNARSLEAFVASLVNDLCRHEREFYFFLDDFHSIGSADIRRVIERLLLLSPPNFHLVVTTRVLPALDLLALRMHDEVTLLSFTELRFDLDESANFLHNQGLKELQPKQIETIHDMTDGWAAGLQVVAYSLKQNRSLQRGDRKIGEALLPNQESNLSDFLERCVVDTLEPDDLEFLVRTSVCRRFNRELCDLITGNPNAGQLLCRFEADGLFVIRIDSADEEPWYRFHRLFAKFLHDRLGRLAKDELADLHLLASRWFAERGFCDEAIRHAGSSGDPQTRIDLVERFARTMIEKGEFQLVVRWIQDLPKQQLASRIELLLCAGWAQMACGDFEAFEKTLSNIEAHPDAAQFRIRFEACLLRGWQLLRADDSAAVIDLLAPYLDASAIAPFFFDVMNNAVAWALVHSGQFERARDVLWGGQSFGGNAAPTSATCAGRAFIGLSFLVLGDLRQAKEALLKAAAVAHCIPARGLEVAGLISGLLIGALYGLNELDEARELLSQHLKLVELIAAADDLVAAYIAQSRIAALGGDMPAALEGLDMLEQAGARLGLDRPRAWSLAERVRLELHRHNLPSAQEALRRLQQIASRYVDCRDCARSEILIAAGLAELDVAMEKGDLELAAGLLPPLIETCSTQRRMAYYVTLRIKEAKLHWRLGATAKAFESLGIALEIGALYGLVRAFLDEGAEAVQMLVQARGAATLERRVRDFAEQLVRETELERAMETGIQEAECGDSINALSPRELEVIRLVSKAHSNKGVARVLSCSENTVKWHLKSIFAKLQAVSREDAVIKARSQKLIS